MNAKLAKRLRKAAGNIDIDETGYIKGHNSQGKIKVMLNPRTQKGVYRDLKRNANEVRNGR